MVAPSERLFFALWPTPEVVAAIQQLQAQLPPNLTGRAMPVETWHITLAFLGQWPVAQRPALLTAAESLSMPEFSLTLDQFGHWAKPRIFWLGLSEAPAPLFELVQQLNTCLQPLGYQPESRPYCPHVTLRRDVSRIELQSLPRVTPIDWPVSSFCLVRSMASGERTRYEVVWRFEG